MRPAAGGGKPPAPKAAKDEAKSKKAKKVQADPNASPAVKVERRAGGRKIYRITTGFVIEGRIQKPNAFYVLQRSQINYDWSELDKDFLPEILEAIKKEPF